MDAIAALQFAQSEVDVLATVPRHEHTVVTHHAQRIEASDGSVLFCVVLQRGLFTLAAFIDGGCKKIVTVAGRQAEIVVQWDERVSIMRQMYLGLVHMHHYGYFHGDFTPSNIIVTEVVPEMRIVVADFGMSRQSNPALRIDDAALTQQQGQSRTAHQQSRTAGGGTPGFMAPEVINAPGRYAVRVCSHSPLPLPFPTIPTFFPCTSPLVLFLPSPPFFLAKPIARFTGHTLIFLLFSPSLLLRWVCCVPCVASSRDARVDAYAFSVVAGSLVVGVQQGATLPDGTGPANISDIIADASEYGLLFDSSMTSPHADIQGRVISVLEALSRPRMTKRLFLVNASCFGMQILSSIL